MQLVAEKNKFKRIDIASVTAQLLCIFKADEFRDIFTVISLLKQHQIHYLPVVNYGNNLLGVITHSTLASGLNYTKFLQLRTIEEVMSKEIIYAPAKTPVLTLAKLLTQHQSNYVIITKSQSEINTQHFFCKIL